MHSSRIIPAHAPHNITMILRHIIRHLYLHQPVASILSERHVAASPVSADCSEHRPYRPAVFLPLLTTSPMVTAPPIVHPRLTVTFLWTLLLEVLVRLVVSSRLRRTRRRSIRVFTPAESCLLVSPLLIVFHYAVWSIPSNFQPFAIEPNLPYGYTTTSWMSHGVSTWDWLKGSNCGRRQDSCMIGFLQSDWLLGSPV